MLFPKLLEPFLVLFGYLHFKLKSSHYCYKDKQAVGHDKFKSLNKLLCESYDNIPFYKEKYSAAGFDPHKDFNSLSDFNKVPILSKREARENHDKLINHTKSQFCLEFKTSGSTGNPFRALISPRHWIIEQSCIWRHWSWAGYKFRDKMAIVRSHVPKNDNDLIRIDKLRNFYYFSPFHLSDKHIEFYFEKMNEFGIKFLRGYPSSILAIANYAQKHPNAKLPKFKGILTASERLAENDKRKMEKYLNAPVFNHYGLAEQIVMFGGCEEGTHLHNYEEYGHLELLDIEGSSFKKIIGTNLNNYAMPLIRYDTGDLAEVFEEECSCSRVSPSIKNVIGREDATITLADGSKIPVTNFYTMFEYYDNELSSWQLVQEGVDNLKVILDIKEGVDVPSLLERLDKDINDRLFNKLNLTFDVSGSFVYVGEGKKNPFIKSIC
jgi:phenylacetate-CoA ligase